jgi:hypothetical protein
MALSYEGIASVSLSSTAARASNASTHTILSVKLRGEQLYGLAILSFHGHLYRPQSFDRIMVTAPTITVGGTVIDQGELASGGWLRFNIDTLYEKPAS